MTTNMSLMDNILDSSLLDLRGDFDTQLSYLLDNIRLSRSDVEDLSDLFRDLELTLGTVWPGCQVYPFGSVITGLGIKTSDVDCYVSLPKWERKPDKKIVMKAKQVLARQYGLFTELFAIPQAKVPIVKFLHVPTKCYCDVNFKSPMGVENSKLVAYFLHVDSRVIPLAVLIKYWSKIHNLTGTNLMPNYGLTLLVIFYLQQLDILPSVFALQKYAKLFMTNNWNTAFDQLDFKTENQDSLYKLIGGFFEYYSSFDYEQQVISPFLGKAIKRESFKQLCNVPDELNLYKNNVMNGQCMPLKLDSRICLQDPFEHCRNCCAAVYPRLADKLLLYFKKAAKAFEDDVDDSFLRQILTKVEIENSTPSGNPQKKYHKPPGNITKRKKHQPRVARKTILNLFEQFKKQTRFNNK